MVAIKTNLILDEYKASKELHEEFCEKVEGLISDILKQKQVNYHSIESRVKHENSLLTKVENSDGKYNTLSDITDVSGLRIITYFSEDVDKIAGILQDEFDIDNVNSVDKRMTLDPDRFGYLSLHYVVKLNSNRVVLSEYQRFKDLKVEIQIRSILQHAWAEIEHDLGYKSKHSIPTVVRREFSRLAGLLELADEEFVKIRNSLKKYNEDVKDEIEATPSNVLIDKITIIQLQKNKIVKKLDSEICKIASTVLTKPNNLQVDNHVKRLKYLGFNTIDEVLNALENYEDKILAIARGIFKNEEEESKRESLSAGISIFYLAYAVLGIQGSIDSINKYMEEHNIGSEESDNYTFAKEIIEYINN